MSEHCGDSCVLEAHVYTQDARSCQTAEALEQNRTNGLRGWTKKLVELVKDRLKIPRSHILRARWVLTWKNVGTVKGQKARLCALGFQDPRLTTLPTSSPTLTSDGESDILQWIVNKGHLLESGDLKTAFLSGDPDPARKESDALYIDPPSDLKRWLNLGPEDVLRLRKGSLWPHQRTPPMASEAQPSPSTSWVLCHCTCTLVFWILPASSPVKGVSPVDVPTNLEAAVADSSVSLVPEIRVDCWIRQRNVQGVLGSPC